MRANIYVSSDSAPNGRNHEVIAGPDDLEVATHRGVVEIWASCSVNVGSGERGGEHNPIHRRLSLLFHRADFEAILKAVHEQGFFGNHEIDELFGVVELRQEISDLKASLESARLEAQRLRGALDNCFAIIEDVRTQTTGTP